MAALPVPFLPQDPAHGGQKFGIPSLCATGPSPEIATRRNLSSQQLSPIFTFQREAFLTSRHLSPLLLLAFQLAAILATTT
ncbi:MAG: hypothetical protein V4555_12165, partial [Acidobacteriota bacterium]